MLKFSFRKTLLYIFIAVLSICISFTVIQVICYNTNNDIAVSKNNDRLTLLDSYSLSEIEREQVQSAIDCLFSFNILIDGGSSSYSVTTDEKHIKAVELEYNNFKNNLDNNFYYNNNKVIWTANQQQAITEKIKIHFTLIDAAIAEIPTNMNNYLKSISDNVTTLRATITNPNIFVKDIILGFDYKSDNKLTFYDLMVEARTLKLQLTEEYLPKISESDNQYIDSYFSVITELGTENALTSAYSKVEKYASTELHDSIIIIKDLENDISALKDYENSNTNSELRKFFNSPGGVVEELTNIKNNFDTYNKGVNNKIENARTYLRNTVGYDPDTGLYIGTTGVSQISKYSVILYINDITIHKNNLESIQKNADKYLNYTKTYAAILKALSDANKHLADNINPYKVVLDSMQIMTGGDYFYSGSVINENKIEGIIAYKDKLIKSSADATAHKTKMNTLVITNLLDTIIAAHTTVLERIEQLIASSRSYSNSTLESQLKDLSYYKSGSWEIVKANVPLEKTVIDNVFNPILLQMNTLTNEQRTYTSIYEKMQLVYDMRETLLQEVDEYFTSLINFGLWKLGNDNKPITDTNDNYVPNSEGLIAKISSTDYEALKNHMSTFTQKQITGEMLTNIALQFSVVETHSDLLKQEIADIFARYSNLSKPELIADKQSYIDIKNLLQQTTSVSGNAKLTSEQIDTLVKTYDLLNKVNSSLNSIQGLEDAVASLNEKFELFYQEYSSVAAQDSVNILKYDSFLKDVNTEYNKFTTEQQGLFGTQQFSLITSYQNEIRSRDAKKANIDGRYNTLQQDIDTLLSYKVDIENIYNDMIAFNAKENDSYTNDYIIMKKLYDTVNKQFEICIKFANDILQIDADKIISQKSIMDNLKSIYEGFTSAQKTTLSSEYNTLSGYLAAYDTLIAEVTAIKAEFDSLQFFDNGTLNIASLYADIYSNSQIVSALISRIQALNVEQGNLLSFEINNLQTAQKYLDSKSEYDALNGRYVALLANIVLNTNYITLKSSIESLLSDIKSSTLFFESMSNEIDILSDHIVGITNLENEVVDFQSKYKSIGENYIANSELIKFLYESINGSIDTLTEEQIQLLKNRNIDGEAISYFAAINNLQSVLDSINATLIRFKNEFEIIKGQLDYDTAYISKKSALSNLKLHINNESSRYQDISHALVGVLQEIDNYLLKMTTMEQSCYSFLNDFYSIDESDPLIFIELIQDMNNRFAAFTNEQKTYLISDGINYNNKFIELSSCLKNMLQEFDEIKIEIGSIIDTDEGLIAYKVKLQELSAIFSWYNSSAKDYMASEIAKCNALLQKVELLENSIELVKNQIQSLPTTQNVTTTNTAAVNAAVAAYNNLTNEQKSIIGDSLSTKLFALLNKLKILQSTNKVDSATIEVSDSDLAKNILVSIDEINNENITFNAYQKQVQAYFNNYSVNRVYRLNISPLSIEETLHSKVIIKINSSSTKYFIALIKPDGTVQKVESKYLNGQFIFETNEMGVYALVSTDTDVPVFLYVGIAIGVIVLIIIAIFAALMFIPSYKIIKDGSEYKIKITRMGLPIKNYRFYVNGVAINENIFTPCEGLITLCYSYKSLFYYTDTLDEMAGCKRKSKII